MKKITQYIATHRFYDTQDKKKYIYNIGDVFPREGLEVTEERLKELSTKDNKLKKVVIKAVEVEFVENNTNLNNPTKDNGEGEKTTPPKETKEGGKDNGKNTPKK